MSAITEDAILKVLSRVQDPDLNQDIVSLGFVKNIEITGSSVRFDVELTTPACPVKEQLREQCLAEVRSLGVGDVSVNMTSRVRSAPVFGNQHVPGIRNLIAVASGKGGVGKSTVCINLAIALAKTGARVGVMDCDLYGPSVPSMVGMHNKAPMGGDKKLIPHEVHGLKTMSMGFLIERNQPLGWRGPMLSKMLQQFLFHVAWGELDYLLLDLPPGTGDVQLTLTQSTPLSASILVTTPQDVALRDVEKGLAMFKEAKVPVLGIVENMSYYLCGKCSKKHRPFGQGGGQKMANSQKLPLLGELPLDPKIPSELGAGEPVVVRDGDGPLGKAFQDLAGQMVAQLSRISQTWANPGPGAMEV